MPRTVLKTPLTTSAICTKQDTRDHQKQRKSINSLGIFEKWDEPCFVRTFSISHVPLCVLPLDCRNVSQAHIWGLLGWTPLWWHPPHGQWPLRRHGKRKPGTALCRFPAGWGLSWRVHLTEELGPELMGKSPRRHLSFIPKAPLSSQAWLLQ